MRALVILTLSTAVALRFQQRPQNQGSPSQGVMVVGTTVQVSKPFPKLAHYENLAAGDPDHVGRLLACSTVTHEELAGQGDHCYVSFDNGMTWATVLDLDEGPRNSDPVATYGRGDTVFVVNEYIPNPGAGRTPWPTKDQNRIDVYRSLDGGKRWQRSASFPFVDRQAIVVDKTAGKYAGRVYISGVSKGFYGPGGPASVLLYRSVDGGSSFVGPVERPTVEGSGLLGASNNVALSDGTLAFTTFLVKKDRSLSVFDEGNRQPTGNAELQLLTSTDGGESLNPWVRVSDVYLGSSGAQFAQLAVDPGSPFFKDRLYVVWPDAVSGRTEIRFAYSMDKGKTWSSPITVSDDRSPPERGRGPDHLVPSIGVNKAGAVFVAWYDRRESTDNMSWKIRAAASLDGGVTFTPSVLVSDVANAFTDQTPWVLGAPSVSGGGTRRPTAAKGLPIAVGLAVNSFLTSGGDTNGMAVGADGVFHPMWVDNRTGVSQLWTAPITVRATVEKHGARELADLEDITDKVTLQPRSTRYDRSNGTLTLTATLTNTSKETVRAPVKVRLTTLTSQLGVPAVVDASNGVKGRGAIWDFTATIPLGGLLPDSASAQRMLTFHLSDVRPMRLPTQQRGVTSGLVDFEARVYGKVAAVRDSTR